MITIIIMDLLGSMGNLWDLTKYHLFIKHGCHIPSGHRSTRLQVQLRHGATALGPEPEHCHVGAHHAAEDRLGIPEEREYEHVD